MLHTRRAGFTLVEILIVVVILGILAAIVIPQFSRASSDATKSSLRRQVQMINNNIELYRVQHAGLFPTSDPSSPMGEGGPNDGWGALIGDNYLKEVPVNMYTGSRLLIAGSATSAAEAEKSAANGWQFLQQADRLDVFPTGFNMTTDRLSNETP
ncbi:MAG: type II secretion system protein [Phycisphaerales bacterium]|nr:type II secretion system protein [Phycisphaerales bacterium]